MTTVVTASIISPPHFMRGKTNKGGLAMHLHPSFAERLSRNGLLKKRGGAPKGASSQCPRGATGCCPRSRVGRGAPALPSPACGGRLGGGSPSGAPPRRLPKRPNAQAQPRPRFTQTGGRRRYPRHRSRLSGAPRAPVVVPEGDDAQTARERVTTPACRNRTRSIVRLSPATSLRLSERHRSNVIGDMDQQKCDEPGACENER
jgi:hypothetical protein